jgi:hypothetical protein
MKKYLNLIGILFLIHLSSCEESPEPIAPIPIVEVPELMKGEWLDDWSFTNEFEFNEKLFNPSTGLWFEGAKDPWSMGSRPGLGLKIYPDGSFVWITLASTGVGGCQSFVVEYLKGTLDFEEEEMIFRPILRRKKYQSTCNPEINFDRNESVAEFRMEYHLLTQDLGNGSMKGVLSLMDDTGNELEYHSLKPTN